MPHVDLLEISGGNHLIVVDNYSCWPEVILLMKTDAVHVTKAMVGLFHTWLTPECLQ